MTAEDPAIVLEELNAAIHACHQARIAADRALKIAEDLKDQADQADTRMRATEIRYRAAVLGLGWV